MNRLTETIFDTGREKIQEESEVNNILVKFGMNPLLTKSLLHMKPLKVLTRHH